MFRYLLKNRGILYSDLRRSVVGPNWPPYRDVGEVDMRGPFMTTFGQSRSTPRGLNNTKDSETKGQNQYESQFEVAESLDPRYKPVSTYVAGPEVFVEPSTNNDTC